MDALTLVAPAVKRAQMAAGGLYMALVAHINDPATRLPLHFPLPGPVSPEELAKLRQLFQDQSADEKYALHYVVDGFLDAEDCRRERYALRVTFADAVPEKQQ
jgi:hypothetical protein